MHARTKYFWSGTVPWFFCIQRVLDLPTTLLYNQWDSWSMKATTRLKILYLEDSVTWLVLTWSSFVEQISFHSKHWLRQSAIDSWHTVSQNLKILGVIFTSDLKWGQFFANGLKLTSRRIHALRILKPIRNKKRQSPMYKGNICSIHWILFSSGGRYADKGRKHYWFSASKDESECCCVASFAENLELAPSLMPFKMKKTTINCAPTQ